MRQISQEIATHVVASESRIRGALDLYDIDYDLDDGDRIMVDDSLYDAALDAFDEYDIEYEEV